MIYLLGEIWLWLLPAFLLGWLTAYLTARIGKPAKVEVDQRVAALRRELETVNSERQKLLRELSFLKHAPAPADAGADCDGKAPEAATTGEPDAAAMSPEPMTPAITVPADAADDLEQADAFEADDLTLMKGVGPKLAALLTSLGVRSFAQIAAWSDADVADYDARLGQFRGRIARDQWVEQARLLAAGDADGFVKRFGALG